MEVRGFVANLHLELLPDVAVDRIARGEPVLAVLANLTYAELAKALPTFDDEPEDS